jgi:hypothetical protein
MYAAQPLTPLLRPSSGCPLFLPLLRTAPDHHNEEKLRKERRSHPHHSLPSSQRPSPTARSALAGHSIVQELPDDALLLKRLSGKAMDKALCKESLIYKKNLEVTTQMEELATREVSLGHDHEETLSTVPYGS